MLRGQRAQLIAGQTAFFGVDEAQQSPFPTKPAGQQYSRGGHSQSVLDAVQQQPFTHSPAFP
jgi:hypothetical protein